METVDAPCAISARAGKRSGRVDDYLIESMQVEAEGGLVVRSPRVYAGTRKHRGLECRRRRRICHRGGNATSRGSQCWDCSSCWLGNERLPRCADSSRISIDVAGDDIGLVGRSWRARRASQLARSPRVGMPRYVMVVCSWFRRFDCAEGTERSGLILLTSEKRGRMARVSQVRLEL